MAGMKLDEAVDYLQRLRTDEGCDKLLSVTLEFSERNDHEAREYVAGLPAMVNHYGRAAAFQEAIA